MNWLVSMLIKRGILIRECAAWDAREDPHGGAARASGCGGEVTRAGAARWTEWALRLSFGRAAVRFCEQVRQQLWLAELYEADRT
jgi:hypothetical protein